MDTHTVRHVISLMAFPCVFAISPIQASVCTQSTGVSGNANGTPYFYSSTAQEEVTGQTSTSFAVASSLSSVDSNKIHIEAVAFAGRYGDSSSALAFANLSCQLTILSDNGEPIGDSDTFSLDFLVDGNMDAEGANSGARLDVEMSATGGLLTGAQSQQFTYVKGIKANFDTVTSDYSSTQSGPTELAADVISGSVTVKASATLTAGASGARVDGKDKLSFVDADFSNTISLFLTFSNPHLYAVDANGNIWSRPSAVPVPIPGAVWLFSSALCAILFPVRSRRAVFRPSTTH